MLKQENQEIADSIEIVLFGKSNEDFNKNIPFKIHNKGLINNEQDIIELYNAADIFVLPSLEDNLPNTIMESMACGTPVVAFNSGGIPEMIDHQINGYLAEYKSVEDLKNGILNLLQNQELNKLSKNAIQKVSIHYSQAAVADKYKKIYQSLV